MKLDYKCAICHRKPSSRDFAYKGWICQNCCETRQEDIKEHNKKLLERRKYKEVEYRFESLEELMKERFVYFGGKLYHIAVIRNWSYHFLEKWLDRFNKAILNEKQEE